MIPDLQILDLAEQSYSGTPTIISAADCFPYLTLIEGAAVWNFRGTDLESIRDVLSDCDAVSTVHPLLGTCHAGFLANALSVTDEILRLSGDRPLVFGGHSKGAAEAAIAAALCMSRGRAVAQLTTYGMPRPGALNGWISGVLGPDYWNTGDPVPDVPEWLPHPRDMLKVGTPTWTIVDITKHLLTAYRASLIAAGGATAQAAAE